MQPVWVILHAIEVVKGRYPRRLVTPQARAIRVKVPRGGVSQAEDGRHRHQRMEPARHRLPAGGWEVPTASESGVAGPVLRKFLTINAMKWQYTQGARNLNHISPDTWTLDQALIDREGNKEIQLQIFYDYGSNPPLYPQWQAYFRKYQPPTLVVWGKNDPIFPAKAAEPYKRDLKNLEFHLLDTGHFALEEDGDLIAAYINNFLDKQVKKMRVAQALGK